VKNWLMHAGIFMRKYVFNYVCVCMYVYMCMYVCMYVFVCVCLCMFVYAYACMCMYVCVCMCMYVYVCVCMCMYVYVRVCMCIYVYVCVCMCMYVYVCVSQDPYGAATISRRTRRSNSELFICHTFVYYTYSYVTLFSSKERKRDLQLKSSYLKLIMFNFYLMRLKSHMATRMSFKSQHRCHDYALYSNNE